MLAGGCFWGVQAVFQHVEGVERAVSGYAGGTVANPSYRQVSTGTTGHAEAVEVTFDPRKVSLGDILQIYFSVAHDPTESNRQGPDTGTQYRSEIFVADPAEAKFASDYIAELNAAKTFARRSPPRWRRWRHSIPPRAITRTTRRCIPTSRISPTTTRPRSRR